MSSRGLPGLPSGRVLLCCGINLRWVKFCGCFFLYGVLYYLSLIFLIMDITNQRKGAPALKLPAHGALPRSDAE